MANQIPRAKLITDLQEFAADLGKTPTKTEFNEYGPHYVKLYQNKFGSWNDALRAADLEVNLVHNIPREDVLADIERVAGVLGKTPTMTEMDRYGKYSKLTYQRKLDSFVKALEDLGFDPSVNQYNFSTQDKPPELQGTKNVRKLQEDGPTPASDLPLTSTGFSDKKHGLAKFSIKTGLTGKAQAEAIYYLFDDHDPADVIRTFFNVNPQILDHRTRKAIVGDVGGHGNAWSKAVQTVLDEFGME